MKHAEQYDALILDLDGVITRTAAVHARAWKQMFDEFLVPQGSDPFDIESDYPQYVDGKPRYDGVRSFLGSRGIKVPEGSPNDSPEQQTVQGLGNRKNALFHELLGREGVEIYEDTVAAIRRWRESGRKTAVVSSSKNGARVLEIAGLTDLFDVRVDGQIAAEMQLPGKPRPDIFLEAARRLHVPASRCVVVEDAIAGVQAGRAGEFGLVVGVARGNTADSLRQHGADLVVHDLSELDSTPTILAHMNELCDRAEGKTVVLFLDYDGTLTSIVDRPEDARLAQAMREVLRQAACRFTVAIVSGRDRPEVEQFVQLDNLYYAGSHGFDISGPDGMRMEQEQGRASLPQLDQAEAKLRERLASIEGVQIERKRFAIAVHYRRADEKTVPTVEQAVDDVRSQYPKLRKRGGKKIFELQPDVDWDKGRAVLWLLEQLELNQPDVLPVYIGDDVTDEDAFAALADRGIGILVSDTERPTQAMYRLRDPQEVQQFLTTLTRDASAAARSGR